MTIERVVLLVAGSMILLSLALAYFGDNVLWLLLTAFVGANLVFSSLTRFCPMVVILKKFGLKHGSPFQKDPA